jgi:hypothetical protein
MASSIMWILAIVAVSGSVVICLIVHLLINARVGMVCPCGHHADLCIGENMLGFGGKLVYWYKCLYCKRESEHMINKEAARKSWVNKFSGTQGTV